MKARQFVLQVIRNVTLYEECMYIFKSRQMTNLSCPCMHFPARDSVHMTQTS